LAGRGGRRSILEFIACLATAIGKSAPGIDVLEFKPIVAGRGGRNATLEFSTVLATAFRKFHCHASSVDGSLRALAIRSFAIFALPSRMTSAALILAFSNASTATFAGMTSLTLAKGSAATQ
jgi:hypothetical protein